MNQEQQSQVFDILRKVNLTINAIKESSSKLLPFTSDEYRDQLVKIWEEIFHEKRANEKDRIGLFFILHELLYRSNNKKFQDAFYEVLLTCIAQVTDSEHIKLRQEIIKLIKLWTDHKIYDSQKIIRLTIHLNLEDSSKDEILLGQLPENLPNSPNELITFAQNYKELQKYKEKASENQQKLQQLYDVVKQQAAGVSNEMVSAANINDEINNNMNQLKRNLELESKYRTFTLKSYREILNILDKQHMKTVIELKLFIQKIQKLESIRDMIELP